MSVQGFIQTLCDLHYTPVRGGLHEQFSICYDVFLTILDTVETRVMRELNHTDLDWRLANCCATCTFELQGEEQLEFSMFGAMDSNDSLKRFSFRAKYPLAIVERLLKFGRTINHSPLQELASMKKLCVLLHNLGTYLTGLGLEDLETLE
ncbi:hypothetical protein EDD18DRAFT_1312546 [Armillaria luteobubalina]|uniref:Uncharacterized protein n=1 Tax=Armillaria luteobubalina TaxID=153913 RepID=A0AA39P855_9AGAR|nr:hypothetical protein EDD18DRAFT_1312546 [Armillaria luteobubalina]